MMRPVPRISGSISWSEVQVQTSPCASNSISRVKSAGDGNGKTVNCSVSGRKRIMVSELEPVIQTSPLSRFTAVA